MQMYKSLLIRIYLDDVVLLSIALFQGKLPDRISIRILGNPGEALKRIEILYHFVLGGGIVIAADGPDAAFFAGGCQRIHHGKFHVPLQNPAAHEPEIDVEPCGIRSIHMTEQNTDNAVVAEAILQLSV